MTIGWMFGWAGPAGTDNTAGRWNQRPGQPGRTISPLSWFCHTKPGGAQTDNAASELRAASQRAVHEQVGTGDEAERRRKALMARQCSQWLAEERKRHGGSGEPLEMGLEAGDDA
jgi:hypothetical protein